MKKFIFALITVSASLASAVTTANCPAEISISYKSITLMSPEKLKAEIEKSYASPEDVEPAIEAVRNAKSEDYQVMIYTLQAKKNSECRYAPLDEKLGSVNETRLITRNGRDILRVSILLGNEYVWVYHDVVSYSQDHIEVAKNHGKVLGYVDHGSPNTGIAWANGLELDAR